MTVINVRSPYVINIGDYGSTQVGSKIEISIYQKGVTPPTSGNGFYSLSKSIPSTTQKATYYNISNYIKEFINSIVPISGVDITCETEGLNNWVFADVKLYWNTVSESTLINTITFTCVNGYTLYQDGKNFSDVLPLRVLTSNSQIKQIPYKASISNETYFNLLTQVTSTGDRVDAEYYTISSTGTPLTTTLSVVNGGVTRGIYNMAVPLSLHPSYDYFNTTKITLKWYASGATTPSLQYIINTKVIEECKYTPVKCSFINRYGGWEFLNFFKAQTNTISTKGTDYKLNQEDFNYNVQVGQAKSFNINGTQTIKLNTGFVDENYSELITDLLLSETILLDEKPVMVKTQGSELKTSLKDKMINYEIEFEYAYNLINDVI
jgi:hypothetical protein